MEEIILLAISFSMSSDIWHSTQNFWSIVGDCFRCGSEKAKLSRSKTTASRAFFFSSESQTKMFVTESFFRVSKSQSITIGCILHTNCPLAFQFHERHLENWRTRWSTDAVSNLKMGQLFSILEIIDSLIRRR